MNPIHRRLFDLVKKSDIEGVVNLVRESSIDVASVVDEAKNFSQTPVFQACILPDQDKAVKMIKVLTELGINPAKEDSLKQTPLFYALSKHKHA